MHYHLSINGEQRTISTGELATWRALSSARSALKATKAQRRVSNQPKATLSIQVCHCSTTVGAGIN